MRYGTIRTYATPAQLPWQRGSTGVATKPRRIPAALSLEHFLQRQRVLGFWREIIRATNRIADQYIRSEMRGFAREEFERNRGVQDVTQIRYLISTGREQMKTMQRYVEEMASK